MAYSRSSSSTVVRLNADLTKINLIPMQAPADGSAIIEGAAMAFGSDGRARLATAADTAVFVNFVASARTDVSTTQTDPQSGASIRIETGGLTGIPGSSTMIGLPATTTYWSVAPTTSDVGKFITVATGKFVVSDQTPSVGGNAAGDIGVYVFGSLLKVEGGIAFFLFNSVGWGYDAA